MKTLVLLTIAVLYSGVSGYLIKVPTVPAAAPILIGHTQWVHIQKLMIPLFENVCETSSNPIIIRLAQEFTWEATDYLEPVVINNLQNHLSAGLLPKGTVFTEYDPAHMTELKIIYEVLYNAKTFDTFYKAAAWARQNLNCVVYVNAIYMAVQNRRDTERLSIPAPYELLPNYFIDKNVIIKVSAIFTGEDNVISDDIHYEGNTYTIDANYTAAFYDNDDDSKLAYFREDIGLNSYYYLRKLKMAPWFNNDINGSYGENMYQMMKQFMARYDLERYANGLPEVESINWNSVNSIPYDPMLIYSDGNEFGKRTTNFNLPDNDDVRLLQTIESNILSVVSHLRQSGYSKTQILNHLMEILVTSDRSYETLARKLFGKDQSNNGYSSVLEHYMTTLRDPIFWKINKKIVEMIDESLKLLPKYARNELYFPGVELINIEVKKMTTACDYFKFDVTDALKIEDSKFKINIGQPRLNHKQFTIKLNVSSLVSQKGMVKIYLGPKIMPGELSAKKNLFALLDVFEITLKKGSNIISRTSDSMTQFSDDFMLLETIRKSVEDTEFGLDSLPLKTIKSQVGYPSRLVLPKGTPQGLPLQILVFIVPYVKARLEDSYSKTNIEFNTAILSPGYPLDLMVENEQLFELPNSMIKYITVTQKSESKVENYGGSGVSKAWYGADTYDPSSRPDFSSKKGQYGHDTNFEDKVNEFNVQISDNENDNAIRSDDLPSLRLNSKSDSSSRGTYNKESFDYRTKKTQYDNKAYSVKSDYTKYRINSKVEPNISTTNLPVDKITIEFNNNFKDSYINSFEDNDENERLAVEPLPWPAMLKKDSEEKEIFDYKAKKNEREYKIKGIKKELDNLIKDAKKNQYNKNKTVETTSEATMYTSEENKAKVVLSTDVTKWDDPFFKTNFSNSKV